MNVEVAQAILEVAKEGGYFEDDVPEDEDEAVKEAEFYLMHAQAAVDAEQADEFIEKIVELGAHDPSEGYEPEPEPGAEAAAEEDDTPVPEIFKREHLPVPRQIQGDPPEMPFDISECSNKEIRSLASQFQACLNRAIYMMRQTMDTLLRAKQLRAAAYRKAYLAEANAANETGAKQTKEALDIAAQESPEYKKLDERVFELEQEVNGFKALKEVYEGNVGRLSREATIRDDEFKRSGKG